MRTVNGIEANYMEVAEELNEDLKDFMMREMLKLLEEQNEETEDEDTAIINYVMNSFEFS